MAAAHVSRALDGSNSRRRRLIGPESQAIAWSWIEELGDAVIDRSARKHGRRLLGGIFCPSNVSKSPNVGNRPYTRTARPATRDALEFLISESQSSASASSCVSPPTAAVLMLTACSTSSRSSG